jgi:hypothetical protein
MATLYLKNTYPEWAVFYKLDRLPEPSDEYVYEGVEIVIEDDMITKEEYEFTEEDLQEMYRDGFQNITAEEYLKAERHHENLDL